MFLARLLTWLAFLVPATAAQPAVRLHTPRPTPPTNMPPADLVAELTALTTVSPQGCTLTVIDGTEITATHCIVGPYVGGGWTLDGDIATRGPLVHWADPTTIPVGATVIAIARPHPAGTPVVLALTSLGVQTVPFAGGWQRMLMTVGNGAFCADGSSGSVGWTMIDGRLTPVGTLSAGTADPAVTGLPAGLFVCGFALAH